MLVEEFIEKLKKYNPKAEITLVDSEDITLSYICRDINDNILDETTTSLVFIEGIDKLSQCAHEYMDYDERMCSFYGKPCRMVSECFAYEEFEE